MQHVIRPSLIALIVSGCLAYAASPTVQPLTQRVTPAPSGPFHVAGNHILDSNGRPFLMKGTQATDFSLDSLARDNRAGFDFGTHSATVFSAIRLRFNMNTVRLPLNASESTRPGFFAELAKVVRRANDVDLLVVLAAREPGDDFWNRCASYFKNQPNVMFDLSLSTADSAAKAVASIRAAGAAQPVIVPVGASLEDLNIVYQVAPTYATARTDAQRDAQFGLLAAGAPVVANGLDLDLDDPASCSTIPSDPAAASALVESNLNYLDAHDISWTVSVYKPGKLITELFGQDPTSLENGWTCGHNSSFLPGIGRIVEAHLRTAEERKLYIIGTGGGIEIARGGYAIAYGPIMAKRDSASPSYVKLPRTLNGITIKVTDAAGVTRLAGISWTNAGWGSMNFVIPPDSAIGPAQVTVERWDGSSTIAAVSIADTVPGFWTPHSCVGPVKGIATQRFADGRIKTTALASCQGRDCKLFAVPVAKNTTTRVQLSGSGFRYADSASKIEVTIGGVRVPVVSFGPAVRDGMDQMTIEIPSSLAGVGETDLICHIDGRVSNAVRIRI